MMSNKEKESLQFWMAVIITLAGIVLLFCSFFAPPKGEIHPSVLAAIGEVFTFAGAVLGIDYRYKRQRDRARKLDEK